MRPSLAPINPIYSPRYDFTNHYKSIAIKPLYNSSLARRIDVFRGKALPNPVACLLLPMRAGGRRGTARRRSPRRVGLACLFHCVCSQGIV